MGLERERVYPAAIVHELFDTVRPLAAERGSELVAEGAGVPGAGVTDPRRVRKTVLNLLSNAIKFGEGLPVRVRTEPVQGGGARVSVSDQRIGIEPGDAERIFHEFVQLANPARSDVASIGTGLGLAISRQLAGPLGGTLAVPFR